MTITIKDETVVGKVLREIELEFFKTEITLKELIAERVRNEVAAYNKRLPAYFQGLVQPSEAEQTLNGFRVKQRKEIDAEKQVYVALDAFQKNGFFVIVNDQQLTDLDASIKLSDSASASFIKLTPLVGG